ncbi:unnamed protein product [Amoebophrya sp. A25]|nr:unnamed protein product [Amoebophrya sp. A25]|eukprot:GSA25T00013619001.1
MLAEALHFMRDQIGVNISNHEHGTAGPQFAIKFIGIAGIPGAGKSTLASMIQTALGGAEVVAILPMDGWHIPLAKLRESQGERGVYWRGAPETFDESGFVKRLSEIRKTTCLLTKSDKMKIADNQVEKVDCSDLDSAEQGFLWPSFDHAIGDPDFNARVKISPQQGTRLVLVEGLYVLHFAEAVEHLDGAIALHRRLSIDEAVERLKERNKCIPGYSPQEIERRCDDVDRGNAQIALKSIDHALLESSSNQNKNIKLPILAL